MSSIVRGVGWPLGLACGSLLPPIFPLFSSSQSIPSSEGEEPAVYFDRMSITREELAEVGIHKSDQEASLHLLRCLTSDVEIDKILQYAPDLTLTQNVEHRRVIYIIVVL